MYDNIQQVLSKLSTHGMTVRVTCDHRGWRVSTANDEEIIGDVSAREVLTFISGILCSTTMAGQFNNA